jgi:3-oxoadipate CoA-transferase alpha subunit
MKQKRFENPDQVVEPVFTGATIMVGGFGPSGVPEALTDAICRHDVRGLTIISNNAGTDETGIARLLMQGCVAKIICSFPRATESTVFKERFDAGEVELELVPQGTLAERIRTRGAGLGGFLTKTGVGTELAAGKEEHEIDGETYILERPLPADFALIKADCIDPRGNLTYRKAARNFNPVMATAATTVLVQASCEVDLGAIDPEHIVTPGIYVDRYCIYNSPR